MASIGKRRDGYWVAYKSYDKNGNLTEEEAEEEGEQEQEEDNNWTLEFQLKQKDPWT